MFIGTGPVGPESSRAFFGVAAPRYLCKHLCQVTIAIGVVFASMVAFPAEPAAAHGSTANGCTGVSDSGRGYDFHAACDAHDRCYGSKPYGSGWRGRRACDRVFRSEMLDYCDRHRLLSLKRSSCRSRGWAYYYGVRALGAPFWANAEGPSIA